MFRCESRAALAVAEASRGSIERFIGPFKRATKEPVLYLGAVIPAPTARCCGVVPQARQTIGGETRPTAGVMTCEYSLAGG